MTIDLDDFGDWLDRRGYATSTARQSMIDAKTLLRCCEEQRPIARRLGKVAKRLAEWRPALREELGEHFTFAVEGRRAIGSAEGRKNPAHSFDDESWRALYARVAADPAPEARVLEIMMVTGLRIGDVFRLTLGELHTGVETGFMPFVQKGGRHEEQRLVGTLLVVHRRLHDAWRASGADARETVQEWVVGYPGATYKAAYQRVDRHFKTIAAGLPGRAHSHRLRRTVAMQTLREVGDITVAQKILRHKNVATTQGYLDEARPDEIAEIQQKLHERFLA